MKIGVLGVSGRMGRALLDVLLENEKVGNCTLSGGSVQRGSDFEGIDLGILAGQALKGVKATADSEDLIINSDVLIDFTSAETSVNFAKMCAFYGKKIVIGSTGINDVNYASLQNFAQQTPIFYSANTSLGINVLVRLVEEAARILDQDFNIEILELHHNRKKDAPSGTAMLLANTIRKARDKNAELTFSYADAYGDRKSGSIGIASIRAGEIIGEHTVLFAGPGERIELTHRASDRKLFALGAVKAAVWLNSRSAGKIYGMNDLLTLI